MTAHETTSEHDARHSLCDWGRKLVEAGLVARTWGNLSCRLGDGRFLITPSGRSYDDLTPADMVAVRLADGRHEGPLKPSAETGLHAAIYRDRPAVGAVMHTHQTNASVVAVARRDIPPILDDQVQILGPTVRVADYALPSTEKMARGVTKALWGRNAALIANHGAVCVGATLEDAYVACLVLEKAAKAFIEAEFLGGAKEIGFFQAHLMHQYYIRKYARQKTDNRRR